MSPPASTTPRRPRSSWTTRTPPPRAAHTRKKVVMRKWGGGAIQILLCRHFRQRKRARWPLVMRSDASALGDAWLREAADRNRVLSLHTESRGEVALIDGEREQPSRMHDGKGLAPGYVAERAPPGQSQSARANAHLQRVSEACIERIEHRCRDVGHDVAVRILDVADRSLDGSSP